MLENYNWRHMFVFFRIVFRKNNLFLIGSTRSPFIHTISICWISWEIMYNVQYVIHLVRQPPFHSSIDCKSNYHQGHLVYYLQATEQYPRQSFKCTLFDKAFKRNEKNVKMVDQHGMYWERTSVTYSLHLSFSHFHNLQE